jgi:KDO2-lipid IV(A) lauroyltransferase
MGMSITESIHLPLLDRAAIAQWVDIEGLPHYVEASQRGKGVIILTAHLGNWEIIPKAFWSVGHCINAIVRPLDNPYLDRVVQDWRRGNGMGVLNKRTDVHKIMRLLRKGETVGFLLDQNTVEQDAVFVDFFGQEAATHKGPAMLALRSGAAVVPVFAIRAGSRHRVVIEKPLSLVRTTSNADDIYHMTALFTKTIESAVARYPAQWLWMHRRWKTKRTGG